MEMICKRLFHTIIMEGVKQNERNYCRCRYLCSGYTVLRYPVRAQEDRWMEEMQRGEEMNAGRESG